MKKLLLFLFCFTLLAVYSDNAVTNNSEFFNRDTYRKASKDFKYSEPAAEEKIKGQTSSKIDWSWLKYLSYAIVIAAIVFLIYRLILYAYAPDNRKLKTNQFQLNETEEEPTIESDLESLLDGALRERNFREAIRIHYLLAIRKLNENKIVVYTIDKTNFEYVSEVGGHPAFTLFRDLTINFEKIWFGDVPADEQKFNSYQINYTKLAETISSNRSKSSVI
jgi:hypothetical protein